jgi:hypothetical protein
MRAMTSPRRRYAGLHVAAAVTALLWLAPAEAQQRFVLRADDGGTVRALVIGIDAYQKVRPLKGAVADARDIEGSLRKMGVTDLTTLVDADANRAKVMKSIEELTARTRPGDLVVLSLAGHGAQEPERVKGSQPDGMDDIFLLAGFEVSAAGSQQRIIGSEFNHIIKQFEARGARVMFIADTCHGGGLTREVDPRAAAMSYRQVDRYVLIVDDLKPISTTADAYLTELDFKQTTLLAAVDRKTKSPEVRIPGIPGYRGALSYAVARAFEGQADDNRDGKVTLQELFTQVRGVVYQLSDQRQNPVTLASPTRNVETDIAFRLASAAPSGRRPNIIVEAVAEGPTASAQMPIAKVRIASLDKSAALSGLTPREAPFEVVGTADGADLLFDPKTGDVLANGDVVAYRVAKTDLPSIVDRAAAVSGIKQMVAKAPQPIKVSPNDQLHHDNSKVVVDIAGVGGRALVLFNIAGDGTVQALYPVGSDEPFLKSADYRLPVVVRGPYGADQVVAVTSEQRMLALEQAMQQLNGRRSAVQAMRMIEQYAPKDARVGTVGLFTAP